jgi:hypothetical protein
VNIIDSLFQQYNELNKLYSRNEANARQKGQASAEQKWREKRSLHASAYFLFMFARLEGEIRILSSQLIAKKQRIKNWRQRAVWDNLPNKWDSDTPAFRERAALLIDKSKHHYGNLLKHYKNRNIIAHGGGPVTIDMADVFTELKAIYTEIRK